MKKSTTHNFFILAIIVAGFTSMMSQILLLRELIIIFIGNELTIGIMLSIWLSGTAIGSGIFGRLADKLRKPIHMFASLLILLTFLLPGTVIFMRITPQIWGIQQGELISLTPILIIPLTVLFPICLVFGFIYTLGCKIYHLLSAETATAVSRVYLYEAIGAGFASLVVNIILIRYLETFQLLIIICTVNFLTGALLLFALFQTKQFLRWIILTLAPVYLLFMLFFFPQIDQFTSQKFWRHFQLLHSETTKYGSIAVTKLDDTFSFFENGFLMFTYPDLFYAEESVHFVLLQHPHPQQVLLIGGGTGESLQQILYHPTVHRIDYVELDHKIIELSKKYLPPEDITALDDSRIFIWNQDGRLYIKQTDRKYDAVIINLPDPVTIQVNRSYTIEFFQQVKQILHDNGVVGFRVTPSENAIGTDLANFLSCLYHTLSPDFAYVIIIPGDTHHFIGCNQPHVLTTNVDSLVQRIQQRQLKTVYVREYYIPYRLSADRMDYLYQQVVKNNTATINYDFKPVGNFYNLVIWTTHFNQQIKNIFLATNKFGFNIIIVSCIVLIAPFLIRLQQHKGRERNFKHGVIASVAIVGFTEISLVVTIILGFQAVYGYAYYQLAVILWSFMFGLALGS